jgi:hypothetical protein
VLEHSAPQPIVAPAYRLRSVDGNDDPRWGPDGSGNTQTPVLTVVGADQLPRPALAFLGEPAGASQPPVAVGVPPDRMGQGRPRHPGPEFDDLDDRDRVATDDPLAGSPRAVDPLARHLIRRRRRDTLGVLACVFVVSMMIGFVPGASAVWVVTALSGVALAAYVALLVHLRRVAAEREQKLRYLRPADTRWSDAEGVPDGRVTTSGRYAHPSNQAALAR